MPCGALDWILEQKGNVGGETRDAETQTAVRNTGVGCHFLLQGISQGQNPGVLYLLYLQAGSLPLVLPGKTQSCSLVKSNLPRSLSQFWQLYQRKCQMLTVGKISQRIYVTCFYYDCNFSENQTLGQNKGSLKNLSNQKDISLSIKT